MNSEVTPTGKNVVRKIEIGHNLMRVIVFVILAIIALIALLTHQDPGVTKSVLSGCATLGVLAVFFLYPRS